MSGHIPGCSFLDLAVRRLFTSLGLLSLLSLSVAAHADSIPAGIYSFSAATNVTEDNHSSATDPLSGTLTFGANGLITGADITLTDGDLGQITFTGNNGINAGGPSGYAPVADYAYLSSSGVTSSGTDWSGQLVLYYETTLDANGGVTVCIEGISCNNYQASYLQVYSPEFNQYQSAYLNEGDITGSSSIPGATMASTPELSSLILFGTGILGVAGLARLKSFHA